MNTTRIKHIISQGEGIQIEYKKARKAIPENLFETVCAMLNREGGDIILGLDDDKNVLGVQVDRVESIIKDIANQSNNPQKLDPPFILKPISLEYEGKMIIQIPIPASSQIHKTRNIVYDRSSDGDFRVTDIRRISELFNRKSSLFSENKVYPLIKFSDFKEELFVKVRNLIYSRNAQHLWLRLNNRELLRAAGLWKIDHNTQTEGYTLAAVLLFAKDEIIKDVLPQFKIDALLRVKNVDRFDDRLYIECNLIEAYDLLMDFVAKHLPDKFHLERDQNIDVRTKLFREVVGNFIIHREYPSAFPATFTIFKDAVVAKNANIPKHKGLITIDNFVPFFKNPSIAKFFIQLGRADEIGSGILNVNKWIKIYVGDVQPTFEEDDVFTITVPLTEENDGINDGINDIINDTVNGTINHTIKILLIKIVKHIIEHPNTKINDIVRLINKSKPTIERYVKILRDNEIIEYKGALKTGGYVIHNNLRKKLNK